MKKNLLLLFSFCLCIGSTAQTSSFIHTSNKYILGPCNDTLIIRGINYAPYNWGYTLSDLKINEIALTGANTVRLAWYCNNPGASIYSNFVALDSAISKCIKNKMIAIIELHDFTCGNDPAGLITGSAWWTNNNVFQILQKYKQSVIVNIANEVLQVAWTSDPAAALATYQNTYQTIITNFRGVTGFDFPLMIDAPDCGENSDAFITNNLANNLITFDPKHNIIFSAHAYWYGYANNDSLQIATKINNVIAQNIPLVLGEIANQQDDTAMCLYNLNYKPLLKYCKIKKVGWLAWSWDHDVCPARQLSSDGSFGNLTIYGNDIVNNLNYGLANGTVKSHFLINSNCGTTTGIFENKTNERFLLYPNPNQGIFTVNNSENIKIIYAVDVIGNKVQLTKLNESSYSFNPINRGVYFIKIIDDKNNPHTEKVVIN